MAGTPSGGPAADPFTRHLLALAPPDARQRHALAWAFDRRLDLMANRLLARSLRPEEAMVMHEIHEDLLAHYVKQRSEAKKLVTVGESKPDPELDTVDLAAWTMVANQLMNLDEMLNK